MSGRGIKNNATCGVSVNNASNMIESSVDQQIDSGT